MYNRRKSKKQIPNINNRDSKGRALWRVKGSALVGFGAKPRENSGVKKLLKKILLGLIMLAQPAAAFSMQEILPMSEVKPGDVGVAYTVVDSSNEIKSFGVNIVGISGSGKLDDSYIMANAGGGVMDTSKGVLQGMSGSPAYINGKLIGAVSAVFPGMDNKACLITPIERMREIWKLPDRKNKRQYDEFDLKKALDKRREDEKTDLQKKLEQIVSDEKKELEKELDRQDKEKKEKERKAKEKKDRDKKNKEQKGNTDKSKEQDKAKDNAKAKTADNDKEEKANVYISGFNDAAKAFLTDKLFKGKSVNFLENPGGASFVKSAAQPLKPGGAMGVALTYGDFSVGATGTVTDVDGKRVLGFGHPFTHRGNVNYFLTNADVVGPIPGVAVPGAKMANIGNIIGRISQDRDSGVAGIVGEYPESLPIKIQVVDFALGRSNIYKSYIAYDEELLPAVASSLSYASVVRTTDTMSEATTRVYFELKTDMADGGVFKRENMFYAASDVGKISIMELAEALATLSINPEKDSFVRGIDVKIEVAEGRRTAKLISAIPDKTTAKPGDKVNFTITLRPYRGKDEIVKAAYIIPLTQVAGTLTLDVRGGGLVPVTGMNVALAEEGAGEPTRVKLKKLADTGKNNEIIIAPGAPREVLSEKAQREMIKKVLEAQKRAEEKYGAKKLGNQPINKPTSTTYLIENYVKTTINIIDG